RGRAQVGEPARRPPPGDRLHRLPARRRPAPGGARRLPGLSGRQTLLPARAPGALLPRMSKALVAMSGGVDSSVAALLLKEQGCDVEGAYMKNWINEDNILGDCPWQQDIDDAAAVAGALGIPFRVVNL